MMRNFAAFLLLIIFSLSLFAQELQYEAVAINIEVPVRVFKSGKFVDNLTMDDFEVYEDGKLQKIVALYLIKKTRIEREYIIKEKTKEKESFTPVVSRNFVFLFEIHEYLPQIGEALEYFFEKVITPGDTLKVITPLKAYDFNREALKRLPRKKIAEQLKEKIKKDTVKGNARYKALIQDFYDLDKQDFTGVEYLKKQMQIDILRQLRDYKRIDGARLLNFADYLKALDGQKHVFLFYQKELIPMPAGLNFFETSELTKNVSFDEERIKKIFSDSSISVHFLFLTKVLGATTGITETKSRAERGIRMSDYSGAIFTVFTKMAKVTGGLTDSSSNIASSLKKAAAASENYYLLYYRPSHYRADGKFRKIKVVVKGRNYRITHRAGYFAD